jgi:hypothetical protein
MFCGNEFKTAKQNMWYIQNKIYGFLLQSATTPLTFPKIVCLKILFLLPKTLPFGLVPSHIIMVPKTSRIQN